MPVPKRKLSEVSLSLEKLIDDIVVNDEEWYCLVTMLIETHENQTGCTLMLNDACENGNRKAVHLINREKMLAKLRLPVKGESSYAVKQTPSVQQIRQSIQTSLQSQSSDTTKDTGLSEAALIKWMIYEVRLEWLARSDAEREEPQPKTKLRRRGEEWRDRVYVDDAPENGPDVYILLTGFHNSKLPFELIKNRVPLKCILRLDEFDFDDEQGDSSLSDFEATNCTKSDCQCSEEDDPINFWEQFDKSQCPDLGIRSFCPPSNLHDLYDRISYVLYDVYELVQAHAAYLCAMKVIHVYESRSEKQIASDLYEAHLSAVPVERTTVDIIVEAMLCQVEQSLKAEDDFFSGQTEQTHNEDEEEDVEESLRQTSLSGVNSAAFARLTEKLRLLNLKYELTSDQAELILRCGDLLNVCRANDEVCDLKDLPRISEAWCCYDLDEIEACKLHLPSVFECCEKEGINRYRAKHLLNLLGLKKIFNSNLRDQEPSKLDNSNSVKDKYYLIKLDDKMENDHGIEKNEDLRSKNRYQSEVKNNNNVTVTRSRSILQNFSFETKQVYRVQQYNNIPGEKLEAPRNNENGSSKSLSNFHDNHMGSKANCANFNVSTKQEKKRENGPRISSDSSCRCVEPRVARSTKLSKPRRLSSLEPTALLRSFENCATLFGLIDARESLGLETSCHGGHPWLEFAELLASPWTLFECFQSYIFAIVQYFPPTDSVLVMFYDERPGRVAERRVTCVLRTPLCLRDFCEYVVDEERDWLQRRTVSVSKSQVEMTDEKYEEVVFKDEDFLLPGSLKAIELAKLKTEEICIVAEMEPAVKDAIPAKASSSSTSSSVKNNGLKVEPTFEFIGYDLGTGRVQVTNLTSSYEASDGTRLRLTRDTWLHDDAKETTTTTSVEIEVPDCCSLRYHEVVSRDESLFHLTTKDGLIVGFARKPCFSDSINHTNELIYDIQISWPSGLIVKPVEYPDAEYPFYVLQYYSTKDFKCESIKDETHRKYLHNGDVVKFFNDGSIVVLRPNGIVITVEPPEASIGDGKSISSWMKSYNRVSDNVGLSRETSFLLQEYFSDCEETADFRYVVLELDGRRYEVADGRIVHELDRLRAILMEEYSVQEKFARRADGTDALFTSDAELIVSFPDGTRTVSSCVIENQIEGCEEEENGFILVTVYNRAEHPKYASVAGHRLSMHQLEFRLDEFRLECGNEVRVEVESASVSISRLDCECNTTSQASFDLAAWDSRLVRLRDKASGLLLTVWREDARFELTPEICEEKKRDDEKPRRCRTFAVTRDGSTTCEYFHRSIWQRHFLQEMFDQQEEASLISYDDDNIVRWLGLLPREEWTMEYKIRKAKPSVVDKEDELPFKSATKQRFLRARLVEDIGNANDENSLISMQRALLRYWREVATGRGEVFETGAAITCECRGEIESWMRDVVLGRVGTIDPESYEAGRQELKRMRAREDEKRTRQMIDRCYARVTVPKTDVLGWDNE